MRARLERFMSGRYGADQLSRHSSWLALGLCVISMFTGWMVLYTIALALLIWSTWRMFSRNIQARAGEAMTYYRMQMKVKDFFTSGKKRAEDKDHRYYKCPNCKQQLRVPKGRGRISIDCPKCHTTFEKKT